MPDDLRVRLIALDPHGAPGQCEIRALFGAGPVPKGWVEIHPWTSPSMEPRTAGVGPRGTNAATGATNAG